ncbi:MAG: hypothetical protein IKS65_06075 [Bacteroidales bacterium]|nr:hypothetical protein [Bacteroidales bacterium]
MTYSVVLFLMVACNSKSPSGKISAMQKRVDVVERQVEELYNQEFNELVKDYQSLDTTVAMKKDIQDEMELLQAYLQQFESQRIVIKENVEFSRKQLSDLKDDVKNNLYDEVTVEKYIRDEEKELRMMEAQIKYFKEKFEGQKEVVKQLRKE